MSPDVITLGINDGHNAGAALVKNGQVVGAIQEERLVNIKNYSGVPHKAIPEVFRIAKLHPQDVDVVAIVSLNRVYAPLAEMPWKVRLFEKISPYVHSHAWSRFYVRLLHRSRAKSEELRMAMRAAGLHENGVIFLEHHRAHAACAYYQRPWNGPTLVLTADGAGDGLSSTVSVGEGSDMRRIASSTYYDSLGNTLYSEVTAFLGMKRWEHEYKCVSGDTPVLLAAGEIRSIAEIFDEVASPTRADAKTEEIALDCSIPVLSLDRTRLTIVPSVATKIYRKRARGILNEIITASGRRVLVTPNHRFQVLEEGVLREVEARELWEGASLGIPRQLRVSGASGTKDRDWASFFGLFLSEGYEDYRPERSTSLFYFANTSEKLHRRFATASRNLFRKHPSRYRSGRTPMSRISLLPERPKIVSMGYLRARARGKRVPRSVMRMGPDGTARFLQSYFEGDGGVVLNPGGGHYLAATTMSEGMANDLSYLLLRHGTVARLGCYRTRASNSPRGAESSCWRVTVSGSRDMRRFAREIGFIRKHQQLRLERASNYAPRTKTDTIPCAALVRALYREGKIPFSQYLTYYHDCRHSRRMSREKLVRFLREVTAKDERIELLRNLANGDLCWDPVRLVRPVRFDGWVYDLYVPGHHTFVGGLGGMVLHNTMGLAPYGKPDSSIDAMQSLIRIHPRRSLEFQNIGGKCGTQVQKVLRRSLRGHRFDNIAAAAQKRLEDLMVEWTKNAIRATGLHRIACAGGTFLNVKANKLLRELDGVDDIFFYPACDDGGTPVGAALEAYYRFCEGEGIKPERHALGPVYYGTEYGEDEIEAALRARDWLQKAQRIEDVDAHVGELVAKRKIVARFQGGVEWGPRALGNRSILADPRDPRVVKRLNSAIKQRDFWMPFAPSILEERMEEYLVSPRPARYMIEAFDTTNRASELAAALHPQDATARPQTLNSWNPGYRQALEAFQEETGVGGVINTSFNLHGYPIVGTPDLALWTFENSELDALAIGNYLVTR